MTFLYSLLIRTILLERFFIHDEEELNSLRSIKIELFMKLLGTDWLAKIHCYHSMVFEYIYLDFSDNFLVDHIVLEKNGEFNPKELISDTDFLDVLQVVSSIEGRRIKLVSDEKILSEQVFQDYAKLDYDTLDYNSPPIRLKEGSSNSWKKKVRKLIRDPVLFCQDSNSPVLKRISRRLNKH